MICDVWFRSGRHCGCGCGLMDVHWAVVMTAIMVEAAVSGVIVTVTTVLTVAMIVTVVVVVTLVAVNLLPYS